MERDWNKILPEVYSKLKPIRGKIEHSIESDSNKKIVRIGIEIETNEFEYNDPFYGKINANKFLHEFLNIECKDINLDIQSLFELQTKEIIPEQNKITGWFSNSLEVIVKEIKFGNINTNREINCIIKFFLTNSDSYGCMNGEIEDHMKLENEIELNLSLSKLLFLDKRKDKSQTLEYLINTSAYEIGIKEKKDLWVEETWYEYLEIEIKKEYCA